MMLKDSPHRRLNALTGEWILVSPHRAKRPWKGQQEKASSEKRPSHDPSCYLCPGNTRANGEKNPEYTSTFVFDNDFAALLPASLDPTDSEENNTPLFQTEPADGTCRVICFSPDHSLSLAQMLPADIEKVISLWQDQVSELSQKYQWIQVFENKGAVMGCSNPHPHGQIWAGNFLPLEPSKEDFQQKNYLEKHHTPLLLDYLKQELNFKERIVVENEHWCALVPFWATWPFETLLLPKRHITHLPEVTIEEKKSLSLILKSLLTRYDNLFQTSFPYSMGWHGTPFTQTDNSHWQLHAHFFPPLLRSASVKKFMVGYEMLANPQRDITAESAAQQLRELSEEHYADKNT